MVSDLKSDLVMTLSQQRPNVHLMDNPAVAVGSLTRAENEVFWAIFEILGQIVSLL